MGWAKLFNGIIVWINVHQDKQCFSWGEKTERERERERYISDLKHQQQLLSER